jgi:ApaG protein
MSESREQPHSQPTSSSSEAVTNNVRVEVESQYAAGRSQPLQNEWFFHYTVRITNEGDEVVQLLSRHWIITDGNGQTDEVRGPGVVGEQPVLGPGDSFQYTSGCPLTTPAGTMRGTYQMVTESGEHFDVEIAPFALRERYTVH